ncbi:MAG TPA: hypothetical protein VNM24_08795 [Burkholderiales bacterium]|nr:hypothetical protein [Burkholderiales bacterium]
MAATVITLLGYILFLKIRDRRARAAMRRVAESASGYLKANAIDAHVTSYPVLGGRRFVVLVEARPSEKLRSSHMLEMAVIDEVRKTTGLTVERAFWRFPVAVLDKEELQEDLYAAQGYRPSRRAAGYTVDEAPIEQFQEAMSALKSTDPSGRNRA